MLFLIEFLADDQFLNAVTQVLQGVENCLGLVTHVGLQLLVERSDECVQCDIREVFAVGQFIEALFNQLAVFLNRSAELLFSDLGGLNEHVVRL